MLRVASKTSLGGRKSEGVRRRRKRLLSAALAVIGVAAFDDVAVSRSVVAVAPDPVAPGQREPEEPDLQVAGQGLRVPAANPPTVPTKQPQCKLKLNGPAPRPRDPLLSAGPGRTATKRTGSRMATLSRSSSTVRAPPPSCTTRDSGCIAQAAALVTDGELLDARCAGMSLGAQGDSIDAAGRREPSMSGEERDATVARVVAHATSPDALGLLRPMERRHRGEADFIPSVTAQDETGETD
jgi:hypothetical protein